MKQLKILYFEVSLICFCCFHVLEGIIIMYFGGCEGGATHSTLVIVNQNGDVLAEVKGEGTNSCIIGNVKNGFEFILF